MKVMVGGTFDPLHDGHKRLLTRSFALAGPDGEVVIGLTTDAFASRKIHPIHPFAERKADLERFIAEGVVAVAPEKKYATRWELEPLSDRFGRRLTRTSMLSLSPKRPFPSLSRSTGCAGRRSCARWISTRSPAFSRKTVAGSPLPVSGAGRSIPTGT